MEAFLKAGWSPDIRDFRGNNLFHLSTFPLVSITRMAHAIALDADGDTQKDGRDCHEGGNADGRNFDESGMRTRSFLSALTTRKSSNLIKCLLTASLRRVGSDVLSKCERVIEMVSDVNMSGLVASFDSSDKELIKKEIHKLLANRQWTQSSAFQPYAHSETFTYTQISFTRHTHTCTEQQTGTRTFARIQTMKAIHQIVTQARHANIRGRNGRDCSHD